MIKKYNINEIRNNIITYLNDSTFGLTGIELSHKLSINRTTISKYLNIFMTEGIIKQKNIGNTNLWFIETEIEQFIFPNDYFKIKNKYFEYLLVLSTKKIYHLIQSCISSNGDITKILFEVIIPSIKYIANLYDQGKIGKFEKKLIDRIILTSIHMLNITYDEYDNRKTVVMISSDDDSLLQLEAMSALFNSKQWNVFFLGNVSDTIGILFDLDLQKFISKTYDHNNLMIIVVLSNSETNLKFFSEAILSTKIKFGDNIYLALCHNANIKNIPETDLITNNTETLLQWSETKFDSFINI